MRSDENYFNYYKQINNHRKLFDSYVKKSTSNSITIIYYIKKIPNFKEIKAFNLKLLNININYILYKLKRYNK